MSVIERTKYFSENKKGTLPAGFEPTRGDPIGFQVQRLNHSAKAAYLLSIYCFI